MTIYEQQAAFDTAMTLLAALGVGGFCFAVAFAILYSAGEREFTLDRLHDSKGLKHDRK